MAHAVIIGKADAIVTQDRRAGFAGAPVLEAADVKVVTPVEFAEDTVALHPTQSLNALLEMSTRRTRPPQSPSEILTALRDRYGMRDVYDRLHPLLK